MALKLTNYGTDPFSSSNGSVNYSINGVNTSLLEAAEMSSIVRTCLRVEDVTPLENPTHGIFLDLIRAFGQNLGFTDITSLRAADTLNGSGSGDINAIAFSNGTALIGGAMPFIKQSIRARMNYQGFGGQGFIDQNTYGLESAVNYKIPSDPIPLLTPKNYGKPYKIIEGETFQWGNPFKAHDFKNNYAPHIIPAL